MDSYLQGYRLSGISKENLSKLLNGFKIYDQICRQEAVLCAERRHSNLTLDGMCPLISLFSGWWCSWIGPSQPLSFVIPPSYGHLRENGEGRASSLWQCNSFSPLKAKGPHTPGLLRTTLWLACAGGSPDHHNDWVRCSRPANIQRVRPRPPSTHRTVLPKKTVSAQHTVPLRSANNWRQTTF